jgi:hypothetical protein
MYNPRIPKPIDPLALLSAVAVTAKKAKSYSAETHVIDLEELRQIIFELQDNQPEKT